MDRNNPPVKTVNIRSQSLSARRAWIEIWEVLNLDRWLAVALRKESVDRNTCYIRRFSKCCLSLSARRAWIEITMRRDFKALGLVALRKESVDRNNLAAG